VRPEDFPLPDDLETLILVYIWAEERVAYVWREYTEFISSSSGLPKTSLIFPIIFCELDFYDALITRLSSRIPADVLRELNYD
jgi:hypothetical protein